MMLYEYRAWEKEDRQGREISLERQIGDLSEAILEAETLLAEGRTDWCLGDPQECLASMKRELAELEWLLMSREDE